MQALVIKPHVYGVLTPYAGRMKSLEYAQVITLHYLLIY